MGACEDLGGLGGGSDGCRVYEGAKGGWVMVRRAVVVGGWWCVWVGGGGVVWRGGGLMWWWWVGMWVAEV